MSSYDTWLFEPYEKYYNECEKREREEDKILGYLEDISVLKTEEEIEEYLRCKEIDDPRETHKHLLGGGS